MRRSEMTEEQKMRRREYDRQWRLNHPDQSNAIRDRYRSKETTRERERAYSKAYYEKHAGKNKPKKVRWISVEDRLPPEFEKVLMFYSRNAWGDNGDRFRTTDIDAGWQCGGHWHVDGCSGVVGIAWMPIPDPPEVEV